MLVIGLVAVFSLLGATTASSKTYGLGPFPIVYPPMKLEPAAAGAKFRVIDLYYKNITGRTRLVNINIVDGNVPAKQALSLKLAGHKFKRGSTDYESYTVLPIAAGQTITVKATYSSAQYTQGICVGVSAWVMDDKSDRRETSTAHCFNHIN